MHDGFKDLSRKECETVSGHWGLSARGTSPGSRQEARKRRGLSLGRGGMDEKGYVRTGRGALSEQRNRTREQRGTELLNSERPKDTSILTSLSMCGCLPVPSD